MVEFAVRPVGSARVPYRDDVGMRMEVDARRATVLLRAVALRPRGSATGAVILIRDVTEVKRRDLALISKDATIREIHHRVRTICSRCRRCCVCNPGAPPTRRPRVPSMRRCGGWRPSRSSTNYFRPVSTRSGPRRGHRPPRTHPRRRGRGVAGVGASRRQARRAAGRPGDAAGHGADRAHPERHRTRRGSRGRRTDGRCRLAHHHSPRGSKSMPTATSANWPSRSSTTAPDSPAGFDLNTSDRLGLQIVKTMVSIDLGGTLDMRRGEAGTEAGSWSPLR